MKKATATVCAFFAAVALITIIVSFTEVQSQRAQLVENLRYRSSLLAEGLAESVAPNFTGKSQDYLQTLVDKYSNRQRIAGLGVIDSDGQVLAESSGLPKGLPEAKKVALDAMDGDLPAGKFTHGNQLYAYAEPIRNDEKVVGALVVIQRAAYIEEQVRRTWMHNITLLIIQIGLSLLVLLIVLRWFVYAPIRRLAAKTLVARYANDETLTFPADYPYLQPLLKEMSQMQDELSQLRHAVSEQLSNQPGQTPHRAPAKNHHKPRDNS